ncbi:MAG: DUF6493 family protein [Actinomycetota bacterium]|nr:DUF6493 family protein [Actinomycetota bacterium]
MSLVWETLRDKIGQIDSGAVAGLLEAAAEPERLALARELEAHIKGMRPEDWWRPRHDPSAALAIAVLGTMPSAARAAAQLNRRDMRGKWGRVPVPQVLRVVRAREVPWLGDLAGRLAAKLSPDDAWQGDWSFVAALYAEAGVAPPVTEAFVAGWLVAFEQDVQRRHDPLADRLRHSPLLDALLPAVFEIDGLGSHLTNMTVFDRESGRWTDTPAFPSAIAELVAEGHLERKTILAATIDRLVRGDRPAWLRPFALLHDELAPTLDEMAGHALDYAQLLPGAPSAVAGLAQRALRAVDDAGRLDLDTLLDVSRPTLLRKEKTLVKTQLAWLDKVARREPGRVGEILEAVAAAFDHPALDLQERAVEVIEKHAKGRDLSWLAGYAAGLGGDLPARVERLSGVEAPTLVGGAVLPLPAPIAMPAPIGSVAELAEEIVALLHTETSVRWERVLAGLVAVSGSSAGPPGTPSADVPSPPARPTGELPPGTRPAEDLPPPARPADELPPGTRPVEDLSPLRHLLDQHEVAFADQRRRPRQHALGTAIRVLLGEPAPGEEGGGTWQRVIGAVRARLRGGSDVPQLNGSPEELLTLRVVEVAALLRQSPVPVLLATPTHTGGNLDATELVERLRRLEAEGAVPWPLDFEQALLRLPRGTSPAVADGLPSAAGRRLAEWLTGGGLPDPASSVLEQRRGESWSYYNGPEPQVGRLVVNLASPRAGVLSIEHQMVIVTRRETLNYFSGRWLQHPDVLSAALPHHREVSAAWALPALAALADLDQRGGGSLLTLLAEADGPFGPAMSLAVAYVLAARHETDRVAAVDAFLTLAASGTTAIAEISAVIRQRLPATEAPALPDDVVAATHGFGVSVGRDLARLAMRGMVKLNRAVPALADAHRAGASDAVWDVVAAALPPLLAPAVGPAPFARALPDLLELASLVAGATGTRGEIARLDEVAARKGNTRLLKEARRLQSVLSAT